MGMNILLYDFIKGLIFGCTLTAIPGPIFFLITQRTLSDGVITGLSCGAGAIIASTIYASLMGVGMSWVLQYMLDYKLWITFFGAFFLIYLGITTYRQHVSQTIKTTEKGVLSALFSTFLLALVNPITVLSYCVFFASFGNEHQNPADLWAMTIGIMLGSTMIVLLLIGSLKLFFKKLSI